ncbi:MAG: FAD-dependent oxidoreductase, partial [Clostridia bacterium]|nr:FAD-dependent oxidoreductase [Clostridia bacterium]
KIKTEKLEDIRPCLSCHQGCLSRLAQGLPISCAVNPACGREKVLAITPAQDKKNVLIIGGGLAGMEAARVCAIRGHKVTLVEKGARLGGNIIIGSVQDFKEDDRALLKWYEVQLGKLPIEIKFNCTADKEMIEKSNAEVVVFATGSTPVKLDFGSKNHVYTADDILSGKETAGENIVIVGGGLVGCETALWLRQQGKNVTIVEAQPELIGGGEDICFANYDMLKDLLVFNKIDVYRNSTVQVVEDTSVMIKTPEGEKKIKADTVMIAIGYRANKCLYEDMLGSNKAIYNIGDSRDVHNIMYAIWDAYQLAREL